jgi:NADPH:quinone reductase
MPSSQYTALVVEKLTDDFSGVALRELSTPVPGPGQVLIAVRAAALNFPDVLLTQGNYQFKPEVPFVPGLEASGEVVAVGSGVDHVKAGDRVVAAAKQGGALGQMMLADAAEVRPMPPNLDWEEAAAYWLVGITAYVSLVQRATLSAGETLLVHGASGGTGLAAVQLGRHLGARVIATGRSSQKLELARTMGAHEVIQLGGDLREDIQRITRGAGVDVVFDPIGGDVFDASLRALAWGGRLLVVGFVSGRAAEARSNYILIKNLSVIGVRAGETVRRDRSVGAQISREVDSLAGEGVLKPFIGQRFLLRDAADALRALFKGSVSGKIVVTM